MTIHDCKKQPNKYCILTVILLLSAGFSSTVYGNEMPLEGFPGNGIVIRNEPNIQIEKEILYITSNKIEVSYIFRNHSDKDIVTEVGFPIPLHEYEPSGIITYPIHADFAAEVNGKPTKYDETTRAIINGKDATALLLKLGISIKDFDNEHRHGGVYGGFFNDLSKAQQKELIDLGVVKIDEEVPSDEPWYVPAWSVETTYYWKQLFPAKGSVSTKIKYAPNPSETNYADNDRKFINRRKLADPYKATISDLMCFNDDLKKWEKARDSRLEARIVDYILTTANYWKKPIKEFNLIIEADPATRLHERASTCFELGRLKKVNETRYEMKIIDFVPKEEISVFFLSYAHAKNIQDSFEEYLYRCAYHIRGKYYDGDRRYYNTEDLQQWLNKSAYEEPTSKQLCIKSLRNEIYARHGRKFTTLDMKQIFESAPWYTPRAAFKEADLNAIEKKNIDFIREFERKQGWN